MSDAKFLVELHVERDNFEELPLALQFPVIMRTEDHLWWDFDEALVQVLISTGNVLRQSTVAYFTERDLTALSRIIMAPCSKFTTKWFGAVLSDPIRLTSAKLEK
jgi:hypothetical protein